MGQTQNINDANNPVIARLHNALSGIADDLNSKNSNKIKDGERLNSLASISSNEKSEVPSAPLIDVNEKNSLINHVC